VRDESRYEPILQKTRPLGNVTINNNVVVNNVVNVNGQTRGKWEEGKEGVATVSRGDRSSWEWDVRSSSSVVRTSDPDD